MTDQVDDLFKGLPPARLSEELQLLDTELQGAHYEKSVTVFGKKFTLRTLDGGEQAWADTYVSGDNIYKFTQSQKPPYVAAALRAINDKPIAEHFKIPDGLPDNVRRLLDNNEEAVKVWRRSEVLRWLLSEKKHSTLINTLYKAYDELDDLRNGALKRMDPTSEDATGKSSSTSSQEKESSSPTPA